ncbi:MAG TPA: hypothetical protein VGX25_27030 [Actinophytocola sp.]|uniref:hypothetical protein n=1 Tax=Actinophytocola sp. TaxID=1872138 RepID=UPI002DDCE168|nr:hypothetical protein [Actinophytocola sp.]HEV2783052.1 hypothetical protein [Actinophytocola sp.]
MSAQQLVSIAPWVAQVISLMLILGYKLLALRLVRSSKTDVFYRDRWTGLLVQRGHADIQVKPRTRRALELLATSSTNSVYRR